MSATDIRTTPRNTASAPQRIWNVVRLHVANPIPTLVVPWGITGIIFGVNAAIWLIVSQAAGGRDHLDPDAFSYNGGLSWIVFFMMVVAIQAMSLSFRFALGFSVTRRDYYLGSGLYFVLLSLLYSTGFVVLAAIEQATNGWGMEAAFFAPWDLVNESLVLVWYLYFMAMLLFFFIGAAVATVWMRWRAYGLYAFFTGLLVLLVGAAWLITTSESWGKVGEFFTTNSLAVIATWTLPITLVSAVVGFVFLRKATPRV